MPIVNGIGYMSLFSFSDRIVKANEEILKTDDVDKYVDNRPISTEAVQKSNLGNTKGNSSIPFSVPKLISLIESTDFGETKANSKAIISQMSKVDNSRDKVYCKFLSGLLGSEGGSHMNFIGKDKNGNSTTDHAMLFLLVRQGVKVENRAGYKLPLPKSIILNDNGKSVKFDMYTLITGYLGITFYQDPVVHSTYVGGVQLTPSSITKWIKKNGAIVNNETIVKNYFNSTDKFFVLHACSHSGIPVGPCPWLKATQPQLYANNVSIKKEYASCAIVADSCNDIMVGVANMAKAFVSEVISNFGSYTEFEKHILKDKRPPSRLIMILLDCYHNNPRASLSNLIVGKPIPDPINYVNKTIAGHKRYMRYKEVMV